MVNAGPPRRFGAVRASGRESMAMPVEWRKKVTLDARIGVNF
jgi:hypothetical protein